MIWATQSSTAGIGETCRKGSPPPPWFEFLVILDFFAPSYRRIKEASSVKIS